MSRDIGSGSFFNLLPDELVLRIFLFLPLQDIALGLTQVGDPRISKICQDQQLWKSFQVREHCDLYNAYKVILEAGIKLKELDVHTRHTAEAYREGFRKDTKGLTVLALISCPRLESLKFPVDDFIGGIVKVMGEASFLRKITFSQCSPQEDLRSEMFFHKLASLKNLKNLTWLNLGEVQLRFTTSVHWVKVVADTCQQLEMLGLPVCIGEILEDEIFNYLLERLGKQLKILLVWGPRLTAASVSNLKSCTQLERLALRAFDIKDLNFITELPTSLQQLCITSSTFSGQSLMEAFDGSKQLDKLTRLKVYFGWDAKSLELDDAGIAAIAKSFPILKFVFLCNAYIGDVTFTCFGKKRHKGCKIMEV